MQIGTYYGQGKDNKKHSLKAVLFCVEVSHLISWKGRRILLATQVVENLAWSAKDPVRSFAGMIKGLSGHSDSGRLFHKP